MTPVEDLRIALHLERQRRTLLNLPPISEILLTQEQFNSCLSDDVVPYEFESHPEGYRFRGVLVRLVRPNEPVTWAFDARGVLV